MAGWGWLWYCVGMEQLDGLFTRETLLERGRRLAGALGVRHGGFDTALIAGRITQYWLTGTMQDALAVLLPDGCVHLFVRKSYDRARLESPLDTVHPITGYRDLAGLVPASLGRTCIETEIMPLAMLERIKKYHTITEILPMDRDIAAVRAVKEPGELALIRESARRHNTLLTDIVPGLMHEGISEADLAAETYAAMVKLGHQGVSRFSMFQLELVAGQIGFGENSLYPTNFDGPGGMRGIHPGAPVLGSRERTLAKGDLVFVDVGFGYNGYHSDKTQVYSFGSPCDSLAAQTHRACREVMKKASGLLAPGVSAASVYNEALAGLSPLLSKHFMGYGTGAVKFLGHGLGLQIDEQPVITAANETVLAPGMVIALEPKCGIEGMGMVGVEETWEITADGAVCLTGGDTDILTV